MNIQKIWDNWKDAEIFSGVFSVMDENGVIFEKTTGYRNQSEKLENKINTAFGIASGTKLFTGLAICKLIDEEKISLNDKIWDILPYDLLQTNKDVTILHLLTHTSGIGDYLDEENPNSYEQEQELSNKYPVYLWENLEYYLQMITHLPQKFNPGKRFGYSNAGFIMLGLIVEAISKMSYQEYVTKEIIKPLKLNHTGFYRSDSLPQNTALGYIGSSPSDLHTNIFSLPIIGGSDGGLYTCAQDLDILWRGIFSNQIFSENMLNDFSKNQVERSENESYGLGVYRFNKDNKVAYYAVGGDFGVDFFTAYFPRQNITVSALGNTEINTYPLLNAMLNDILK